MIWEYLFLVFFGGGDVKVLLTLHSLCHIAASVTIFLISPFVPLFLFALTFCLILGAGVRAEGRCKGIENEWD